jgi:pachytene checkpoint protein 2
LLLDFQTFNKDRMSVPRRKIAVNVECVVKGSTTKTLSEIREVVLEYLQTNVSVFVNGNIDINDNECHHFEQIESLIVTDLLQDQEISFWEAQMFVHVFKLCDTEPDQEFLENEDELPAFCQWELPNIALQNTWDNIIVENRIKQRLLGYCDTSVRFSNSNVDPNIVVWNRMILMHGPPGTGKTTLCKALAQKVFIRNSHLYSSGVLLEINAHSLFSKWFSESGKLVMKLFDHIAEIAEDTDTLVVILIDEVESIAASRSQSSTRNEPGDAIRVVNSVLTSLDALRRRPNVLVLCTSNMVGGIDAAFLDRVDLRVFLGSPPPLAVYGIIKSCLEELIRTGIITDASTTLPDSLEGLVENAGVSMDEDNADDASSGIDYEGSTSASQSQYQQETLQLLSMIVHKCKGMSGRALRKLPLKAHAYHMSTAIGTTTTLEGFLEALLETLKETQDEDNILATDV